MKLIYFPDSILLENGIYLNEAGVSNDSKQISALIDIYKLILKTVYDRNGYVKMLTQLHSGINKNVFLLYSPKIKWYMQNYIYYTIRLNGIVKRFVWKLRSLIIKRRILECKFQNETLLDFDTPSKDLKECIYMYSRGFGCNVWVFSKHEILQMLNGSLESHESWTSTPKYITNPYTNTTLSFSESWILMKQLETYITIKDLQQNELIGMFINSKYDVTDLVQRFHGSLFRIVINKHLHTLSSDDLYEIFYDAIINSSFQNTKVVTPLYSSVVDMYRNLVENHKKWDETYNDLSEKTSLIKIMVLFFINNSRPGAIKYNITPE